MKTTNELAACLGAAQAEAERLYGTGPAACWRPARKAQGLGAATVAVVVAAAGLWIGLGGAPSTIETPFVVAGSSREAPKASAARAADAAPPSAPAVVIAPVTTAPTVEAASPPWQPADPDAWALDPRPIDVPMATTTSVVRLALHNHPFPAEEAESAGADESQPDNEPGGGHEE